MAVFHKKIDFKEKENDNELLLKYLEISKMKQEELFKKYNTSLDGISGDKRNIILKRDGLNLVVKDDEKSFLYFLFNSFKDQFIMILFILAIIDFLLGDHLGTVIIISIGIISALIRFKQDYSVYLFNRKLKQKITSFANVLYKNKQLQIKVDHVVEGDIVSLTAGTIIPADAIVLESKDLFLNQAVFTGESIPIEKIKDYKESKEIVNLSNILLMGSSVVSGSAKALIINTGFDTYLGRMGEAVDDHHIKTNFEIGMSSITKMLIKYMIIVSIVVFIVNIVLKRNLMEAILYSLSVAVGITPSMLPMIVNVNLTKGSKSLARKKTLVKKIDSIQNLGAIDILCTDKTGTLTKDEITLEKYINIKGEEDINILKYAYLNSYYATGIKNLVDKAILNSKEKASFKESLDHYTKVDEIPFDYERRKASVVLCHNTTGNYKIVTKGAMEAIIKDCNMIKDENKVYPITKEIINNIKRISLELASNGMQVIALAEATTYPGKKIFSIKDEKNMTFVGIVAFLDPVKKDAEATLKKLSKIGIKTKILTGDNPYALKHVLDLVGLDSKNIVLGSDIDDLSDKALGELVEKTDGFARVNPLEKERIVNAYKKNGHVVGYMGDGVNDAPSLHASDVGISVNSAVDIAKEASSIILLEKSLTVLYNGVIEGRIVYGNIIKYMKMALSSDFSDVFSVMIASVFLPFLPLLPIQMLLQDFIYDFSQIAIPYDKVDDEFLQKPKKWDTSSLSRFMNIMGVTGSITDVLAFLIFWFILGYNSVAKQSYFQTAWFVECIISEIMIIHYVRTAKKPFVESNASIYLTLMSTISIILTILAPILLVNVKSFHFEILPINYYFYVIGLIIIYSILVEIIKKKYIAKYHEWL